MRTHITLCLAVLVLSCVVEDEDPNNSTDEGTTAGDDAANEDSDAPQPATEVLPGTTRVNLDQYVLLKSSVSDLDPSSLQINRLCHYIQFSSLDTTQGSLAFIRFGEQETIQPTDTCSETPQFSTPTIKFDVDVLAVVSGQAQPIENQIFRTTVSSIIAHYSINPGTMALVSLRNEYGYWLMGPSIEFITDASSIPEFRHLSPEWTDIPFNFQSLVQAANEMESSFETVCSEYSLDFDLSERLRKVSFTQCLEDTAE